jgi:carboxypeptidase C (cathepsin A)
VVLTADGHGMPAPYEITDNEDSFLDATDLMFVDAVSTGYSRPVPSQSPAQFHGIIQDANYFQTSFTNTSPGMSAGIPRSI